MPVYAAHTPEGCSVKDILHYAQMVVSGNCSFYDYGTSERNMRKYNQSRPPLFTAQEITTPVTIFSAEHDTLANPVVGVAPPCIQCNNILYVKQLSTMCVIQLSTMCVIEHSNMSYNTVIYVSCDTICVIHNIYKRLHQHIVRYIKVAYNDRALVGDSLYTVIGIARLESER